jgi:Uma2 family endonuclease
VTAPASIPFRKATRRQGAGKNVPLSFPVPEPGQVALLGRGDWSTFLMLDELLGSHGVRVRYDDGIIEIMSTSPLHERLTSRLASFVSAYCDHIGLAYDSLGHATRRREGEKSAEPDASFTFGDNESDDPDLVIEVALTSGGLDKLAFWARLGAPELWLWEKDRLQAFVLKRGKYAAVSDSPGLPGFPFGLVSRLVSVRPLSKGLAEFRRRLAAGK